MVENFMMSENFVFTREMENVFKENTFKFNQPIDNWWTSLHKIHKKHSLTHTRTCTWRKSGTPQHCGIKIILSCLLLLYRILSPSLNLSGTKCQLFGIFLFFCALSFPSGFSFLSLLCECKLFLFSFSRTELHVVYLFFNMGQRINCCWWLDIVREPEKSIHASAFTQTKHWNYSTITLFLIVV